MEERLDKIRLISKMKKMRIELGQMAQECDIIIHKLESAKTDEDVDLVINEFDDFGEDYQYIELK